MKKLKELLPKQKINEGSISNYYSRSESSVKSAARKIDDFLKTLITDKRQLDKLTDLITDLADEYAEERIYNSDLEKLDEAISSTKSVKDFKFSKDEIEFLQALINGVGSGQHPYADSRTIGSFNMKYVDGLMKKVKNKVPSKFKSQYNSVLLKLGQMSEGLEDMDVAIPSKVERFLDRALNVIKSYNLPRKKEQLVIAKLVDALGMNPAELQQAVQKLKRYKIVKR